MKVLLKKEINTDFEKIEVRENITGEELYNTYKEQLPYTVLLMKVNNDIKGLAEKIPEGSTIEFLDMRTQSANLAYQSGLTMVYLKAIKDVAGEVPVYIHNSLNKGLYTEIHLEEEIDDKLLKTVDERMKELTEQNLPIQKVGCREGEMDMWELEGHRERFYGYMVPSTGYVNLFEIMKYRKGVLLRFPHQSNPAEIPLYTDEKKLYDAFYETAKWQNLLDIEYVGDLNDKIKTGSMREVVQLSEALHEKRIVEIAEDIVERDKRIILIAGPSSSGKTTFARRLCIQLKVAGLNPLYLGTDDYFLDRDDTPLDENGEKNYENLEAVDIEMFNEHMNKLLKGEEVDIPTFDFIEGCKVFGNRITQIDDNQPIVIEGIHGLNDKLTREIENREKYRIYISPLTGLNIDMHNRIPTTDERMLRRMVRDFKYRGKDAEKTIIDWPKVRNGEDKNIFPYSGMADAFFNSVHIYEIAVLKKYAKPLLESVGKDSPAYCEAKRMLQFLDFFDVFYDDDIIANNSILREFIGGSVFA